MIGAASKVALSDGFHDGSHRHDHWRSPHGTDRRFARTSPSATASRPPAQAGPSGQAGEDRDRPVECGRAGRLHRLPVHDYCRLLVVVFYRHGGGRRYHDSGHDGHDRGHRGHDRQYCFNDGCHYCFNYGGHHGHYHCGQGVDRLLICEHFEPWQLSGSFGPWVATPT